MLDIKVTKGEAFSYWLDHRLDAGAFWDCFACLKETSSEGESKYRMQLVHN